MRLALECSAVPARYLEAPAETQGRMMSLAGRFALLFVAMTLSASAGPVLSISAYAPLQAHSPARIVGLAYDGSPPGKPFSFLRFVIQNVSGKPIVSVEIESRAIAPAGCGAKFVDGGGMGTGRYRIHLLPNEQKPVLYDTQSQGVRSGFVPAFFGLHAKDLETAYLQIQFRVGEVEWEDGTKWEATGRLGPKHAFDSTLAAAESEKCSDPEEVATTVRALSMIEEWRLTAEKEDNKPLSGGDTESSDIPQIHFRCILDDKVAFCSRSK